MNANTQFIQDLVVFPAKTNAIPKALYESAEIYQLEMERLFYGPHWHPVAHVGEIPNTGDYKTFYIGEVPILVEDVPSEDVLLGESPPLDPELLDYPPVVRPETRPLRLALSNSFGFGGTNATLVLERP